MDSVWAFFKSFWDSITKFFTDNGIEIFARFIFAAIVIIAGHYLIRLIIRSLKRAAKKSKFKNDKNVRSFLIDILNFALRFVWIVAVLAIAGVKLSGLSTIISSAILAIGLSLQDVIGNFAAGVIILTNKPFTTDDYISILSSIGTSEGTVKKIGMLNTTLYTWNNNKVVVPNKTIVSSNISNYTINRVRRNSFNLFFDYSTPRSEIQKVVATVLAADKRILKDPAADSVIDSLSQIGYSLTIRYWTLNKDYWDVLYDINSALALAFAEAKIVPARQKLDVSSSLKN